MKTTYLGNRTFPRAQDEVRENIRPSDLLDIGYIGTLARRANASTRLQDYKYLPDHISSFAIHRSA